MKKSLIAAILLSGSAFAADNAVLRNGFSIKHERRALVSEGATTRLYISSASADFVDVPTSEIAGFESLPPEIMVAPAPTPRSAETPTLAEIVRQASDNTLIDEDLLFSVIRAESGADPHAVSPRGARGLMQLMPQTARSLGVHDAFDPKANVEGGSRYLHDLLVTFHFDLVKALAAYNAGPLAVVRYNGVPPYAETRTYVARIIKDYNRKKMAQTAARKNSATKTSPASPSSKS